MIPIFIITCDRLEVLKKSMQSYNDCIKTPFEIVIIDFGSTFEPTRDFLRHLQYEGKKVYWMNKITRNFDLNSINAIVQDYFTTHPASNYIVTDPDVALDAVDGDILDVYSYLLETMPGINVVGSAMRIDDIPKHYRNRKRVRARHKNRFWSKVPYSIQYKDKTIRYVPASIDSTFGMSRAGTIWRRLKRGILVRHPYSAKHLDWYLDLENPTPDQAYYMEHASRKIAHWSMWGAR